MSTTHAEVEAIIGSEYPKKTIPLIKEAKHKINIIMYEWKWYTHEKAGGMEDFNLAMLDRLRNGVEVKILLNIETVNHPLTKINLRTAGYLEQRGAKIKYGQVGTATHAKIIIIDDIKAIIGSHNLTKGAFTRNQECSVLIVGAEAIRPFIDYFNLLWQRF